MVVLAPGLGWQDLIPSWVVARVLGWYIPVCFNSVVGSGQGLLVVGFDSAGVAEVGVFGW